MRGQRGKEGEREQYCRPPLPENDSTPNDNWDSVKSKSESRSKSNGKSKSRCESNSVRIRVGVEVVVRKRI